MALVLLVDFSFSMTTAEPTTSAIAAPNPAKNRVIIHTVLFSVILKTKEEKTQSNKPILKYFTLVWISLMKIEKTEPLK